MQWREAHRLYDITLIMTTDDDSKLQHHNQKHCQLPREHEWLWLQDVGASTCSKGRSEGVARRTEGKKSPRDV